MNKWRNQICNIGWATEKKLKFLAEREEKLLKKMADADIEDGKRLLENRYMLDAMSIESRRWP